MKKIACILFLFSLIIPFSINADEVEKERKVETFTKIDMRIAGQVFITQGNNQKVVVKGDEKDVEDLITEVKNGELIIRFDDWFSRHSKIEVHIEMANVNELDVSGSGSIVAKSAIKTTDIEFEVSGSGTIVIDELEARNIENEISGSGKILLGGNGKVDNFDCEISGSGKINAFGITAAIVTGDISGSGKVEITAESKLDADISGSGRIYYKGSPRVNADISGSGKVISED